MDSQKEHLHEEAQTASSATYTTVNNIYGLAFQHCTFHDATFQTLVQGAEGEREKKAKMAEDKNEKETPVTSLFSIENAKELLAKFQRADILDEKWCPHGLTNSEKGVLAWFLADRLKIPNLWQVFGNLWNMKSETLRAAYNKGMDLKKTSIFLVRLKQIANEQ